MNEHGYYDREDFYNRYKEISRVDLLVLGTLMGLFAAAWAVNLGNSASTVDLILHAATTVAIVSASIACFWGFLQWGKPARQVEVVASQDETTRLDHARELHVINRRSKVA